jgi:hypothetical protein
MARSIKRQATAMFLRLEVDRTMHLRQKSRNPLRILPKGLSQPADKAEPLFTSMAKAPTPKTGQLVQPEDSLAFAA